MHCVSEESVPGNNLHLLPALLLFVPIPIVADSAGMLKAGRPSSRM